MVNVVRAVTTAATVKTPTIINSADAQPSPVGPSVGLCVGNLLTRIFCDFATAPEVLNSETAPAFDHGFLNGQTWSEVNLHVSSNCNAKCWITAELITCVTVKEFDRQRSLDVAAIQRSTMLVVVITSL